MLTKLISVIAFVVLATLAFAVGPVRQARACGGFFCSSQPIDQSGENLVFAMEADGSITAHVQILYTGPSETFAWILPVPSVPTISVGTDVLFQQLQAATAPQFILDWRTDGTCRSEPMCERRFWATTDAGGGGGADSGAASVTVLSSGAVGPYETAVLMATDTDALYDWLRTNGYDIPTSAAPEIAHYVSTGHSFVALRLQKDRAVGEIQPIVLHYRSGEPCIPLRLTRIAATPDMPVTAYFLADRGVMSINYPTVEPSLADPSIWSGYIPSYRANVGDVIDESGGRAFVNEYSGTVPTLYLALPMGLDDLRSTASPATFVQAVSSRLRGDSQLLAILERRIPPPPGVSSQYFFNCLARGYCPEFDAYFATLSFDPSATVDDLNTAIVQPRADADAMLARHARLTRLFTVISPHEMTIDPMFIASTAVPVTSNVHRATRVTECSLRYVAQDAPTHIELPSGARLAPTPGVEYPSPEAWCRAHYGVGASISTTSPPFGWPASSVVGFGGGYGGGGTCNVATVASHGGLVALVLAAAGIIALARRKRRPRSGRA